MVTICTARFNIQQFYVLTTQCIYVFCVDLRTEIISLYNINGLVFITETECLLRGTDWVLKCNLGYMLYMDLRTNSDYFPIQH